MITYPNTTKRDFRRVSSKSRRKRWRRRVGPEPSPPLITTAGDEVQMSGAVVSLQTLRHAGMVRTYKGKFCDAHTPAPCKKRKERGTPKSIYGLQERRGHPRTLSAGDSRLRGFVSVVARPQLIEIAHIHA
jgi:hypothetical protein